MIFDAQLGKLTLDGGLVKKFFEKYYQAAEKTDNIGWKLINEMIPESHLIKVTTSLDRERYQIKFLNP
jgi:hypothetical protein